MDKLNDKIQKNDGKSALDLAKIFLDKQIQNKEFVVDFTKIPNRRVREFLKANDYLYSPCKFIYIIKDNKLSKKNALEHNYFNVVSKLWGVVTWDIALNYHLWKTVKVKNIDIITPSKNWEMNLWEDDTYVVRYQKSDKYRDVEKVTINNAKVFIETPTSYLINNFNDENTNNEDFKVLLSSTNFMLGDIKKFIEKWASISSLSRMALWYKDNEKPRNYTLIKTALQQSGKQLNYSKWSEVWWDTEELSKLFSSSLDYSTEPTPDINPKIARFDNYINKLDKQCDDYLNNEDLSKVEFRELDTLLNNIEQNIVHDSYHSLTIENYKVTREDIDILRDPEKKEDKAEDIQNKLTIKWYLHAYKEVVDQIKIDYWYSAKINKSFITHINWLLFSEIAKAKWFEINDKYRTHNVEITWTKHLPPDHILVEDYMNLFTNYINNIDTSDKAWIIKKAIMTHFVFVYIHPFGDGNWRTARFLMNHTLGSDKLDWITILSDRKKEYIDALKQASEGEDISAFTKLITDYLKIV